MAAQASVQAFRHRKEGAGALGAGDGGIVNASTGAISRTTAWADSYTTLNKDDTIGGIPVTIPSNVPAGDYDMLIYDNASPADTDVIEVHRRIAWDGNRLIGLPLEL